MSRERTSSKRRKRTRSGKSTGKVYEHTLIFVIRDVHGYIDRLRQVLELAGAEGANVLDIGGDFTNFGDRSTLEDVLASIPSDRSVVVVHGNHDPPDLVETVPRYLHGTARSIRGLWFLGLGGSNPIGFFPAEHTEEDLAGLLTGGLEKVPNDAPLVVVSHVPPHEVHDYVPFVARHVGSTALRQFIAERRPMLVTCGHIHESFGWTAFHITKKGLKDVETGTSVRIGKEADTVVINAGSLRDRRYGVVLIERTAEGIRVTPEVRLLPDDGRF
ncbi:MAG: metallophosphoesterase [Candidatus Undinarchaeales archaeon]|jgi:hypothetical protein|nr:metallophosphoesterase [Candidatus Undinarchaeales archaeon]